MEIGTPLINEGGKKVKIFGIIGGVAFLTGIGLIAYLASSGSDAGLKGDDRNN